ncbi:MAG: lmo0937 family membrane protein [Janthinobacterium lividum]
MGSLLYIIGAVLVIGWLVSFLLFHVASPIIHVLLVVAVIVFLYQFLTGRRSV